MSVKAIANRYAHALLLEAERLNVEQPVEHDIAMIREHLKRSADLRMLFRSPIIEYWRKKKIFNEIFEQHLNTLTLKFMMIVFEKRREHYIQDIFEAFGLQLDKKRNLLRVHVTSAQALETELQDRMVTVLGKRTGKTVVPTYQTEAELIAGITVTIGDTVVDGSLRKRLTELREQLANN